MRLLRALIAMLMLPCAAPGGQPFVKLGIEVLQDRHFDLLRGKTVGLITNPTGVDSQLRSTIDILLHAPGVRLVALFGPEHGVRGDAPAGSAIASTTDSRTGLPVYSLYGRTRKPTPEMLQHIDVLVYDMQDIGCRSYTYISTMGLAMEAAAEQAIPFVVLDRPDPLGGVRVEGNIAEAGFTSFVSPYPIPYVYGLTCGELASLLNGEGMLHGAEHCVLTVIPMLGWKRGMLYPQTGLPWVPPSPHIPEATTPLYCIASGILGELGTYSVGVGYTFPFHAYAAGWIDPEKLAEGMADLRLRGVLFRPVTYTPFYGSQEGSAERGVQFYIEEPDSVNLMSLQFLFLQTLHRLYPQRDIFASVDRQHLSSFDAVLGSGAVRKLFSGRMTYGDIRAYLDKDVPRFRQLSRKYYLYP